MSASVLRQATPENLSPPVIAKRSETGIWCAPSTFTTKWVDCTNASKLAARRDRLQSTSGGESDTVLKEFTVMPTGSPADVRVVTTVTPVTNAPSARRSSAGSIGSWLMGEPAGWTSRRLGPGRFDRFDRRPDVAHELLQLPNYFVLGLLGVVPDEREVFARALGEFLLELRPRLLQRAAEEQTGFLHALHPIDVGGQLRKERRIEVLVDIEVVLREFPVEVFGVLRDVRPAHRVLALAEQEAAPVFRRFLLVDARVLRHAIALGKVHHRETIARAVAHRRLAAAHRHEDRRMRVLIRRRDNAEAAQRAVSIDLPFSAGHARDLVRGVTHNARFRRERRLVVLAVEAHRVLLPALQHHVHAFLEDLAVALVVAAAVRKRRPGFGELPERVGPARLVAAREADEIAAAGDVVQDRRFLRHPDRVLRGHHVAERTDMDFLELRGPPRNEDTRIGSDFVAFRMQMVLDGAGAPDPEIFRRPDDVDPVVQCAVVHVAVAPQRTAALAVVLASGGHHGVELEYDFGWSHVFSSGVHWKLSAV